MTLHATSVLGAWLFWQVDLWVFLFSSGSWWRSDGWIFLLSTSTNLGFLELFRCCVFRQWKDPDHFIWFRSFRRWFYMIFSFPPTPPPPQKNSLYANLTHPKKRKKKKKKEKSKKKLIWQKAKEFGMCWSLWKPPYFPPTQDSWYDYNIY